MKISLKQFGKSLRTRDLARKVKKNLSGEEIVFDFSGVELMTHSFADELFGVMFEDKGEKFFKENVSIVNADVEIQSLIKRTIQSRKESLTPA